ncbi:MAG: Lrp/AsnC ligand binding domain-containing protein [Promethearchaeota archaeon]
MKLDVWGYKLVKNLINANKFSFSKVSQNLDISRQTLKTKITLLRDKKIINDYTIIINPNLPLNLRYIILEIKTNPKEPELVKNLLNIPQLKMLDGIFGDFSLIALFILNSNEEYYKVLTQIDNIMAKSYFKKYQLIDVIKIFKTNGVCLGNTDSRKSIEIDEIDYLILNILQDKQNQNLISTYEIKNLLKKQEGIDLSQSTIHNRIKKLENNQIILKYSINFNPRLIGFRGKYILRIKPKDPSKYDDLARKLQKKNEIVDLFRIGEQYGLFAIVRVKRIEDYGNFIKDLYISEEIEDTFSNFVLDELKLFSNFIIY